MDVFRKELDRLCKIGVLQRVGGTESSSVLNRFLLKNVGLPEKVKGKAPGMVTGRCEHNVYTNKRVRTSDGSSLPGGMDTNSRPLLG
jgi:hypothetical protein